MPLRYKTFCTRYDTYRTIRIAYCTIRIVYRTILTTMDTNATIATLESPPSEVWQLRFNPEVILPF